MGPQARMSQPVSRGVAAALFLIWLGASWACSSTPADVVLRSPTPSPGASLGGPPVGWNVFRDPQAGFEFAYPSDATLSEGPPARIDFPSPKPSNVVEESLTVRTQAGQVSCLGLLDQGWASSDLRSETIERNGVEFLRQTHAGVAAGTSTRRVTYTTARQGWCISLDFVLSTFDVANLDPTHFPNPPAAVDPDVELQLFDRLIGTFRWAD
jgi:hypothetical protein